MKLKLINFQASRSSETETCFDCGFVSYIYLYELTVEVVSADKHKAGCQHLICFKEDPYIDTYIVNDEESWKEFLDRNKVPECESFDELAWTNSLRKQYQCTMKVKKDKELAEQVSALLKEVKKGKLSK